MERGVFKAVCTPYVNSHCCAFVQLLCWRPGVPVNPPISCHKWTCTVFCSHLFDLPVWVCCMPWGMSLLPGLVLSSIKCTSKEQVADTVLSPIPAQCYGDLNCIFWDAKPIKNLSGKGLVSGLSCIFHVTEYKNKSRWQGVNMGPSSMQEERKSYE